MLSSSRLATLKMIHGEAKSQWDNMLALGNEIFIQKTVVIPASPLNTRHPLKNDA